MGLVLPTPAYYNDRILTQGIVDVLWMRRGNAFSKEAPFTGFFIGGPLKADADRVGVFLVGAIDMESI
jgi:hypothetical protein